MNAISYVIVLGWLLVGGYLSAAGWVASKALEKTSVPGRSASDTPGHYFEFEGITFADEESLNQFLRERRWASWFPWVFELPDRELTPLVASMAFGLLGGAVQLLRRLAIAGAPPTFPELLIGPIFGAVIGLLLFFLALLLPKVFTTGKDAVRLETLSLAAFSLFGGVFSEQAFTWIQSQVGKLFPKGSS